MKRMSLMRVLRRGVTFAVYCVLGAAPALGQQPNDGANQPRMVWGGGSPEEILQAYQSMAPQRIQARAVRPVHQAPRTTTAPQAPNEVRTTPIQPIPTAVQTSSTDDIRRLAVQEFLQVQQTVPPVEVEAPRVSPESGFPGSVPGDSQNLFGGSNVIPWSSDAIRSDTDRVGPYNQPVWTTQRPFPTVRTYVLPPGEMELEQWYRPRWKKGGSREDRVLEELAIGLPYRFQLDVYGRWHIQQNEEEHYRADWEGVQLEMRWALADWGVIPLNPTLYAEWVQRGHRDEEPDKYELKLLLADEFLDGRLFFAGNFIVEHEVGGEKALEFGYSQAFATTIIERKLLAGIEMWYRSESVHGDRSNPTHEFLLGPTVQWRPTNRTFLDVTPLFGVTQDAPRVELWLVFGFQFGNRAGTGFGGITPTSVAQ